MTHGAIRRHPVHERVPVREVEPLIRKLIRREGTLAGAARVLSHYRGTEQSWKQIIHRALNRDNPLMPENRDAIYAALGLDAPPPLYRQTIYRVSGLDPWLQQKRRGSPRNWYYTRKKDAENRVKYLKERGLFIDWAVCDAVWKELE